MIKMANLTCLPNLVSLAQWEQVSPDYSYSSYYYSSTPTIRARLAGPARLRKSHKRPFNCFKWICHMLPGVAFLPQA